MRTLESLGDLAGKTVLVRCDLNVPLEDGPGDAKTITDDGRIRASLPLLQELVRAQAKVVVMAHLGRPKGAPDPAYSLAPVSTRLEELLGVPVRMAGDVVGESAAEAVLATEADRVVMLENVRFEKAETSKDDAERRAFAEQLVQLGGGVDAYVDDAFGAVHRKHASVYDVAQLVPSAAGPLVSKEVDVLRRLTQDPERPYVVVLGGSKVSDKLAVIQNLLPTVDRLLVGGGMCFTFLAAQGHDVGSSLLEQDQVEACRQLLESGKIVLPVDVVAATAFSADAEHAVVPADAIPSDRMGLDIGPESVRRFGEALTGARTVFWNGPMGVFELAPYAEGTRGVAEAIAALPGALTVVGGGDSAAAVRALGVGEDRFTHISTGGGASLEQLEGKALPGLTVLED